MLPYLFIWLSLALLTIVDAQGSLGNHALSHDQIQMYVDKMLQHGYVIIQNHIPDAVIDDCVRKVELAMTDPQRGIMGLVNGSIQPFAPHAAARDKLPQGWRLTNAESHLNCIRDMVLVPSTVAILGEYLKATPTLLQTLYYEYGSGQQTHSDFPNVCPPWISGYNADTLVGSTVYFEESRTDNAALYYYPRSHLNTRVRGLNWQNFPGDDYHSKNVAMHKYIQETMDVYHRRKIAVAQKGTLILWTANLIHGGLRIMNLSATRKSIIAHYGLIPNGGKGIGVPNSGRVLAKYGSSEYFWEAV
jgi:ectoine hydroxylase-related dioxygenase (phytanoyl-CoA dioxygenase family)